MCNFGFNSSFRCLSGQLLCFLLVGFLGVSLFFCFFSIFNCFLAVKCSWLLLACRDGDGSQRLLRLSRPSCACCVGAALAVSGCQLVKEAGVELVSPPLVFSFFFFKFYFPF